MDASGRKRVATSLVEKNQARSKTVQSPASIASGYLSDSHKCSVLVKFSLCRSRSSACGYPVDTVCIRAAGRAVFWVSGAPVSGCGGADGSSEPGCSVDDAAKAPPLEPPPPLRRSRWTSESKPRRRAPSAGAPSSPAARRARPGSPRPQSPGPRPYRPCLVGVRVGVRVRSPNPNPNLNLNQVHGPTALTRLEHLDVLAHLA